MMIKPANAKAADFDRPSFYLAGPIANANAIQKEKWREHAAETLDRLGFDAISPLGKERWDKRAIVQSDLQSIQRATAMIAWVPPEIVSIGTAMEIWYAAKQLDKPVLVWGQRPEMANPWLLHCAYGIHLTLEETLEFISSYKWQFQDPLAIYAKRREVELNLAEISADA